MDFEAREDGARVIHIPAKDLKDFEINICGARGLQIDCDGKEVRVWRHDPLRSEDPYQHLCSFPAKQG